MLFLNVFLLQILQQQLLMENKSHPFKVQKSSTFPKDKSTQKTFNLWTYDQMVKYCFFLNDFIRSDRDESQKILKKSDYQEMSKVVRTRNTNQCRIFHKRMLKIQNSLEEIFVYFSQNIDHYSELYLNYQYQKDESINKENTESEHRDRLSRNVVHVTQSQVSRKQKEDGSILGTSLHFNLFAPFESNQSEEYGYNLAAWLDEV